MFEKSIFIDLLSLVKESIKDDLVLRNDGMSDKFMIAENYENRDKSNFTQINFRFEYERLIIPWFYLKTRNAGIGSKIMDWFIEFCLKNKIKEIEVRGVSQGKEEMQGLLRKYGFELVKDGDYMDFRRIICDK